MREWSSGEAPGARGAWAARAKRAWRRAAVLYGSDDLFTFGMLLAYGLGGILAAIWLGVALTPQR